MNRRRNFVLAALSCLYHCFSFQLKTTFLSLRSSRSSSSSRLNARSRINDEWYNPSNQRIFDTIHRSYLPPHPENYLAADLANKRVIVIGEVHSNPCHHQVEFQVIKSLTQFKSPSQIAIGLECFYRQHQRALDRYIFRHQNIGILKAETRFDETWGYDLNMYAKIFNFAAQNKIRLIGLNVPIEISKLVAVAGLAGLPKELSALMPAVDTSVPQHRETFVRAIQDSSHGTAGMDSDSTDFQHLYEAQTLWDEYMAESASIFLKQYPSAALVVIAGLGHVIGRKSIPDRIQKRTKDLPFVIVPLQVEWSSQNGLPLVATPLTVEDCDWAWYTEREIRS